MPAKRSAIESQPASYHHGDLKTALLDAASTILREEGPEALTLRAVARAVGVSQTAPYRHFRDRRELIAALAEEGFRQLGLAMRKAMANAQDRQGFRQIAIAYVRFAHSHPAVYRIMFGPEVVRHDDLPALAEESSSVLAFVATGIRALQSAGAVRAGDANLMAVAAWAMLHGLVMLSLDGQNKDVAPSLDALVEEATHMVMFGMAPRS